MNGRGSTPLASAKQLAYGVTGSTRDFESLSSGSNPGRSAKGW